ncbi:MAG TPA: histidinol-phosphate transaminase [Chitinophagaceae bacterium]|nr:histidinol-phosphate transaminase [Chitinophagaceae bacterium]
MSFNLNDLVRENIKKAKPYSSARDEFSGEAKVFLDANENSLGSPLRKWYNRYPDPHQRALREKIAGVKSVQPDQVFLGNGSDECIDLLFRAFCEPGKDNVIICPPTYGMYEVSAGINDIEIKRAPLLQGFQLDTVAIEQLTTANTKLIWICSPNNPSGNSIRYADMELLLNNFNGLVVVDEAYINFARQRSLLIDLKEYPNLVVLQTFSKAWGLAGLRLGMAFASPEIVEVLDRIKPPYNINQATQDLAMQALDEIGQVNDMITEIVAMRDELAIVLKRMPVVQTVYPSDANFLLVKVYSATTIYHYLLEAGIVVRDRSRVLLCDDCLRITIGTEEENTQLVDALIAFMQLKNK